MSNASNLENFAIAAGEFVSWSESGLCKEPGAELEAARLLAQLYAAGNALVQGAPEDVRWIPRVEERDAVSPEAATALFKSFPVQHYWEVFDAAESKPEAPVCGDVIDDLSDTYIDVKVGLNALARGEKPWALRHWQGTFLVHWGRHAACAVKALHDFRVSPLSIRGGL
jgi:Domain of unknown function (DUF5063)